MMHGLTVNLLVILHRIVGEVPAIAEDSVTELLSCYRRPLMTKRQKNTRGLDPYRFEYSVSWGDKVHNDRQAPHAEITARLQIPSRQDKARNKGPCGPL